MQYQHPTFSQLQKPHAPPRFVSDNFQVLASALQSQNGENFFLIPGMVSRRNDIGPALKSLQILGVIPKPPAAFSPFIIINLSPRCLESWRSQQLCGRNDPLHLTYKNLHFNSLSLIQTYSNYSFSVITQSASHLAR